MWYCAAKLVLKIDIFLDLLKFYIIEYGESKCNEIDKMQSRIWLWDWIIIWAAGRGYRPSLLIFWAGKLAEVAYNFLKSFATRHAMKYAWWWCVVVLLWCNLNIVLWHQYDQYKTLHKVSTFLNWFALFVNNADIFFATKWRKHLVALASDSYFFYREDLNDTPLCIYIMHLYIKFS